MANGDTEEARKDAYKKSCKAGNMSTIVIHPDLKLRSSFALPVEETPTFAPATPFKFGDLPTSVQARIFRIWLTKRKPLHCLSRMCPYGQVPIAAHVADGYPRRLG